MKGDYPTRAEFMDFLGSLGVFSSPSRFVPVLSDQCEPVLLESIRDLIIMNIRWNVVGI